VRRLPPLLLALLVLGALPAEAGGKAPLCAGGRFVLGAPLLPGSPAAADAVDIAGGRITIETGCAPVAVKLVATSRGTKVKATWKGCGGVPSKVKLKGLLDPTCQTLNGTLRAAKARLKQDFTASLDTGVRTCEYDPAVSQPTLFPLRLPPASAARRRTPVPQSRKLQEEIFGQIWSIVRDRYVYPDFNGIDWNAAGDQYFGEIQQGLSADAFYAAMQEMIGSLGDDHSRYETPQEVAVDAALLGGGAGFVGMGTSAENLEGTQTAVVLSVYPNSPAEAAGLKPHDVLLEVDGLPFSDEDGKGRSLGPEGTSFVLTYQRPGQAPQTVPITRRAVGGFDPIDACLVPGRRIGYLRLPSFFDHTLVDRVRLLLRSMTASGPLDGLVIDNRWNPGGSSDVALPALGLFTSGFQGSFVGRSSQESLTVQPEDVGGSQSVPLAVLGGEHTVSFGEIFTGALQNAGRATVVGEPTAGNVELLYGWQFVDGSQLWLAAAQFAPSGLAAGVWEGSGVQPDVPAAGSWELFTEATDPALAAAVGALSP
jgi:carboxyl-terminal processing protease